MKISKIFLYDEPSVPEIQITELAKFLKEKFSVSVEIRENILKFATEFTPRDIASCRIFNARKPYQKHSPTTEEIYFEQDNITDTARTENVIMYDGFELQLVLSHLIPDKEKMSDNFHVIFTNKLTCTYDNNDYRYHGRAVIGSNPSIISTTGIIEAPAKPREYYFELINRMSQGLNLDSVNKKYKGTYLEYHDQRLSKIIEGYLLQAIFYYITGEAFCEDLDCQLFNAHWQKDLLYSQLQVGQLCAKHQKILDEL